MTRKLLKTNLEQKVKGVAGRHSNGWKKWKEEEKKKRKEAEDAERRESFTQWKILEKNRKNDWENTNHGADCNQRGRNEKRRCDFSPKYFFFFVLIAHCNLVNLIAQSCPFKYFFNLQLLQLQSSSSSSSLLFNNHFLQFNVFYFFFLTSSLLLSWTTSTC